MNKKTILSLAVALATAMALLCGIVLCDDGNCTNVVLVLINSVCEANTFNTGTLSTYLRL